MSTPSQRTILAIGAHCGDVEVTCAAVLAKHKKQGDRIVLCHLTLGEGGNPRMSPQEYGQQKRREALAVAEVIGAEAGAQYAVAFDVDPFEKKRVVPILP